ncbi:D-alanyl-D-alanine carboxypeptidase family protein, partial [Oceanospirillum sp. HFRX-1_2]
MRIFRQIRTKAVLVFSILGLFLSVTAQAALIPAPPKLAAKSYILIDADSGHVLVEHNADKQLPPASLTKMMTAYLVESEISKHNLSPEDKVRVSVKAWKAPGSRMFIKEGDFVAIQDLLKGIIIQSGNDASIAVAEHIGGSEAAFADLMTQHAQMMGMKNTQFMNATGLPKEGHYSTAHDLAILANHIIKDFPDLYSVYSQQYFTYNGIRQANRNRLLWRDKSVDGLKTGHTDEAGYCLVSSAKRGDMRLISV